MEEDFISSVQTLLRQRLCGKCHNQLRFRENEIKQLHDLVHRTATVGESNSLLVIGPRGSGKSTLLEGVLDDLTNEKDVTGNILVVRLNGLLQTDDKIALAEITRQLQLEAESEGKAFGSFAENLQFLLEALRSGSDRKSRSLVFVLDEFDLFAHHRNQTLLYNLFDVAQSAQAPICVIGLTVRMDVLELLEKRVKSRFSHRFIHLLPTYEFKEYLEIAQDVLTLPQDFASKKLVGDWNKSAQEFMQDSSVIDVLQQIFYLDKSIQHLYQLLMIPVCKLNAEHTKLLASDLYASFKILHKDDKAAMLQGVSILELTLVLAMKHLNEVYDGEPFNFEMVFSVYKKFTQRAALQSFQKAVVIKAFEHLCSLEIVRAAESSTSRTQREFRALRLMADSSQIMEAVKRYPACPNELKHWSTTPMLTL